jgi:cysteine desulfurase / selenocysteine lyase
MPGDEVIYMDYAATSALRPPEVGEAVARFLGGLGATPGRAAHRGALEAGRMVLRCRQALAALFGISGDPGRVVFQLNATHALNTLLRGLVGAGDVLVRTAADHNAVRRTAADLRQGGVEERILPVDAAGAVDMEEASRLLRGAALLVLPHVSNVLGSALPVRALADVAHREGALVVVDAAQSAGHLPLDVTELGADALAFTGHKGLLGPQGVGGFWLREGVEIDPLLTGGTGGDSAPESMPASFPDRVEAGTLPVPAIAGLLAGVEWLQQRGVAELAAREAALKERLLAALDRIPGVSVRSPRGVPGTGLVMLTVRGMDADQVARRLDADFSILVRAGLHCAPEAHRALGTLETGAVRLSLGWASEERHVDAAAAALAALSGSAAPAGGRVVHA